MTMTDPIADMLTRLRNANVAYHDEVRMPSSKLKESLAAVLQKEGYVAGWKSDDDPARPGKVLTVQMKYSPDRARSIAGIKRVSKPGLRVYRQADRRRHPGLGSLGPDLCRPDADLIACVDRMGRFAFEGDPVALYAGLRRKQRVAHGALIGTEDFSVLSMSPELFFRHDGKRISTRPMKGTAPRGVSMRSRARPSRVRAVSGRRTTRSKRRLPSAICETVSPSTN